MKLTVIHNNIDLSLKMDDLTAPEKVVDLTEGVILIGFHKPVKHFYIEIKKPATEAPNKLKVQVYNGTAYVDLDSAEDRTFGLNKSGFVFLGEVAQSLNVEQSKSLYWIKLTLETPVSVGIKGINLVLSDDSDFGLIPNIMSYLPEDADSFIGFHQEARNLILQSIRNSGKTIRGSNCDVRMVDQFDILNIDEFRQAAKYKALHLIFDYLSKGEDQYATKAASFDKKSEDCLSSRLMTIDSNDNGKTDSYENKAINSIRIIRE